MIFMLFDLHIHEKTYSFDSRVALRDIIEEAKRKGLNGICITDHESNGLKNEALILSQELDFTIIVGIEILTTDGDLLIFGVNDFPEEQVGAQTLINWVNTRGGVTIAAHPYRKNNRGLENKLSKVKGLTAIEGINGRTPYHENEAARLMALSLNSPMTGGSDAHLAHEVGSVATRFNKVIRNEFDLVEAIKSGVYEPVVYNRGVYRSITDTVEEIIA